MQFGIRGATLLAVAALLPGQAGLVADACPGVLVAGDFDGDKVDDVLVLGVTNSARTYYGSREAPSLRPGPQWSYVGFWYLADLPVFVGGCLYVPVADFSTGGYDLLLFQHGPGGWIPRGNTYIGASSANAVVNSLKIAALDKDIDNNKGNDLIAVYGEEPMGPKGVFHAAYIGPGGVARQATFPPVQSQPADAVVADLHLCQAMSGLKTEFLVSLSGNRRSPMSGFGFLTLQDGLKVGAGIWATGAPILAYGGYSDTRSPVCYGKFNLLPVFGTPIVKLITGESLVFKPWVTAPYVQNSVEFLYSSRQGFLLDSCTGDYDGDGRDEIVLIEGYGKYTAPFVNIGDPSYTRAYAQFFHMQVGAPGSIPVVFHGTRGDFDGDGDQDALLSCSAFVKERQQGFFAFFRTNRSAGAGRPALTRIY